MVRWPHWVARRCRADELADGSSRAVYRRWCLAVRESSQFAAVEDLHVAPQDGDEAVVLQPAKSAAHGLQRQAEETRDVLAAHRQPDIGARHADVVQAFG